MPAGSSSGFLGISARDVAVGSFTFILGMFGSALTGEFRNYVVKPVVLSLCGVNDHPTMAATLRSEGIQLLRRGGQDAAAQAKFDSANNLNFAAYRCWSDDAAFSLGVAYCRGGLGLERTPLEALKYLRYAKEAGHPLADMFLLQFISECTK